MATVDFCAFDSGYVLDSSFSMTEKWMRHNVTRGMRQTNSTADKMSQVGQKTQLYSHSSKKEDKTFWQKYKKVIWITTGVVLLGAAVAAVVILTAGTATPLAGSALSSGIAALAEGLESSDQQTSHSSSQSTSNSVSNNIAKAPLDQRPFLADIAKNTEVQFNNSCPISYFDNPGINYTPLPTTFSAKMQNDPIPSQAIKEPRVTESNQNLVMFPNRNLPVFTSKDIPTSQTWGNWVFESQYMDYVADPQMPPPLPQNNTSFVFRTPGNYCHNMRIGGINGIGNSLADAILNSEHLKKFTNGLSVEWVYNCSNNPIVDALEAGIVNMSGYSPNTEKLLRENWLAFHQENKNNPHAKYFQQCHSQGAIHVKNALEELPKEIRERILVVAIAPATIVPDELCYRSFNYASKADIVPYTDLIITQAKKALAGGPAEDNNIFYDERVSAANDRCKELIMLDPHSDAVGLDHNFQSKTYMKVLLEHIEDYLKKEGIYN